MSSCAHSNDPLGYVKCVEFFGYLRNYWLHKKDSAVRISYLIL
jgi:hypothetical protein